MKKLVILVLFSFGFWHVFGSGYMLAKAHLSQFLIKDAWQKTLTDKENHKPWSWADTYPVFEILIPRLDKKSVILEGESGRNMAFSATHTFISGMPGQNKTTVVSGHRDSHFEYLQEIRLGDSIIANGINSSYQYKVMDIKVINSRNEKLQILNKNELILTTCYPFNSLQTGGNLRYVVYALPV